MSEHTRTASRVDEGDDSGVRLCVPHRCVLTADKPECVGPLFSTLPQFSEPCDVRTLLVGPPHSASEETDR